MDNIDDIILHNIKREIESSSKKKCDIAKAIGISSPTLSQYLSGRAQPTLATLTKLCRFLDISADDILPTKIQK